MSACQERTTTRRCLAAVRSGPSLQARAASAAAPVPSKRKGQAISLPVLTLRSTRHNVGGMTLADFPKLKELPPRQKLKLAEELWFDGVSDDALPVPDWHKKILSERLAAYKAGSLKTISVAELKRRLGVK